MIAFIEGKVAEKNHGELVINAGGVGFSLLCSNATVAAAPDGDRVFRCYTVMNVREDAMELYGFYSKEEKHMYERLKGVTGVGSRTALQILSAMSVRDLSIALISGDANALTRVPGIGKKTAQRLVLELKDKVDDAQLTGQAASISPKVSANGPEAEAIAALISLGYSNSEAARAVSQVADQTQEADKLIFLALKGLGG